MPFERRPSVLIVDDSPTVLRIVRHFMEREGYQPLCVASGAEALALAASTRVDLCIVDVMMPELDGIATLGALRALPALAAVPVVMLTASGDDNDRRAAREAGAAAFISKPVNSAELLATVRRLLAVPAAAASVWD